MYILLVGYPPFWDEDQHRLYAQIKAGAYDVCFLLLLPLNDYFRLYILDTNIHTVLKARTFDSFGTYVTNMNRYSLCKIF